MKIAMVFCVLMVAVLPGRAGTWRDDFEDGDYGGWTVQNVGGGFSEWEVKLGELTVRRSDDWGSFVILDESIGWADYEMQVDVMFQESLNPEFTFAPVNVRVSENSNNYNSIGPALAFIWQGRRGRIVYARAAKGAQNISLVDIVEEPYPVELGEWYRVKVSATGNEFQYYVDGVLRREFIFDEYESGGVSMGAGGCIAHFDNVTVSGPDIPNGGPGFGLVQSCRKLATKWSEIRRAQ